MEKLIFHNMLLLPTPPFFLCSMLDLIFRTCWLSREHSLNQPQQHWAGGGRGGVIFNWKEREKGHFGSLENGLLLYKPIPRSWQEPELCCESIKFDKSANKVSYIVSVHYIRYFQKIFEEDCRSSKNSRKI